MARKVNPFDSIDRITLTSVSLNKNPITIEFKTKKYIREDDGRIIPTKCEIELGGIARPDNDTDKNALKAGKKIKRDLQLCKWFFHGKTKWMFIHQRMILLMLNLYRNEGWTMKIKTVESKSNKQVYESVCKYFGIELDREE